jgi:hypothetical protein
MWRRRAWPSGVVLLLVVVAVVVADAGPAAAQARVRVTPTTDLVDQQQVKVSASGFPPPPAENRIAIFQCVAEATVIEDCGDFTAINRTTDDTGSVTTRYRVSRILQTPALGPVDCAAAPERCIVVVTSLDLTEIVTVPISFDPSVPPLPPVDIDAALAPEARVNTRTGVVTLSGTVTCTFPTPVRIVGFLAQQQGDMQIFGDIDAIVRCSGTRDWSLRVRSRTPGGAFTEGLGFVNLTVVVDRSGPRDGVELDTLTQPLIAGHGR